MRKANNLQHDANWIRFNYRYKTPRQKSEIFLERDKTRYTRRIKCLMTLRRQDVNAHAIIIKSDWINVMEIDIARITNE